MLYRTYYIFFIVLLSISPPILAEETADPSLNTIIKNMDLAVDPENNKAKIKTLITEMELNVPNQDLKLKTIKIDKFPDKSKTIKEIPGVGKVIRILNGSQAWETSSQGTFRQIEGKELELMKFELFMKNPSVTMQKAFKEIIIADHNALIDEDFCFKLVCKPALGFDIPPVVMYVNKDNFLTKCVEMSIETPNGPIKMLIFIEEYKNVNGRKVPSKMKINQFGAVLKQNLISVKENEKIDDSEFENPGPVEVYNLEEQINNKEKK